MTFKSLFRPSWLALGILAAALVVVASEAPSAAKAKKAKHTAVPAPAKKKSVHKKTLAHKNKAADKDMSLADHYCTNVASKATDARMLWQAQTMRTMASELEEKIKRLEARTADYKKWLARREEFVNKATAKLIEIYAKMRPDAAATQLATLDLETAAAILIKLKSRTSGAILGEMETDHAARLAATISGSARVESRKDS